MSLSQLLPQTATGLTMELAPTMALAAAVAVPVAVAVTRLTMLSRLLQQNQQEVLLQAAFRPLTWTACPCATCERWCVEVFVC